MMTSKSKEYTLCSLLFQTVSEYVTNLQTLLNLINKTQEHSLIVAPEVCLTGFDYKNINKAVQFTKIATAEIKKASCNKIIILTMFDSKDNKIYNFAKVFYNGELVYERAKARLFTLGNEHKYMSAGSDEDFNIIKIDGIKIAVLICFELRFKELWLKVEGADIVALPSWWGASRSEHFNALSKTLAIMNQCYVVASDSLNAECSKMSSIVTPRGNVMFNGNNACLESKYSKKEIKIMRKYINVGIQ